MGCALKWPWGPLGGGGGLRVLNNTASCVKTNWLVGLSLNTRESWDGHGFSIRQDVRGRAGQQEQNLLEAWSRNMTMSEQIF